MTYKTLEEWLEEALPGMPKSLSTLKKWARKESWQCIKGEYSLSCLPKMAQEAYSCKTELYEKYHQDIINDLIRLGYLKEESDDDI